MPAKQLLTLLALSATLAACGPSQNAPQDQNTQQQPPPAAAPAPQAAAPAPQAEAAQATSKDQEIARLKEEQRRLERRQRQLDEEARARQTAAAQSQQAPPPCPDCGVVASVTPVRKQGTAGWAGTLGGAAAGGLAGNQFGKGKGNIAMTALGVVGGAFAGREVEKQVTADTAYQVTVNMDSGGQRVVTVANGEGLAPGTKVHVDGNSLLPY
jgi:outer membrane lipoprotein SlyB